MNYVLEAPNAQDLRSEFQATSSGATEKGHKAGRRPAVKSQAWAKYQLPGHDLVGSSAWNQEHLDSAASYNTVPMAMSLDLASKDRPDGIQYRVGLHQVCQNQHKGASVVYSVAWPPRGGGLTLSPLQSSPALQLGCLPSCSFPAVLTLLAQQHFICNNSGDGQ